MFGPFRVFERLGVGGTSAVFRARRLRDDGTEIEVSLKRLHPHLASDRRVVAEFVNEARIAALLEHDNICRFFELGRLGGEYFIASEYIEGADLGRLLQRASDLGRHPPLAVALTLLCALCDALDYVHSRVDAKTGEALEVVHRDISPSNIIVTPGGALKLIDLGIAKTRASAIKTETGLIKGKLSYMAPEVIAGRDADKLTDIFSAGVVAWELLTAQRLFGGPDDDAIAARVRAGAFGPPSSVNAACPPQLDEIVMRALSPRRGARWSSAAAMRTALRAVAATLHEPLEATLVARWVESLREPATNALPTMPTPTREATTQVLRRTERTQPRRPPRFPTGTGQLPLLAPADPELADAAARAGTESVPALPPPLMPAHDARAVPRLLPLVLGASVFVNIVLMIGLISAQRGAEAGAETAPSEPPAPHPVSLEALRSERAPEPPPVTPPPPAAPDAGAALAPFVEVEPGAVTRVYGKDPRSRSSRAPFRARLCIDSRGRVTTVDVIDGPERLHRRIARALSHWRYRPLVLGDEPTPACFDHAARLGAW